MESPKLIKQLESNSWKEKIETKFSLAMQDLGLGKVKEKKVRLDNLHELRFLLELCKLPEDEIQDTISHENAHANKTDALGIKGVKNTGYCVNLGKNDDDSYYALPMATSYIPFKYRFFRKKLKQIKKEIWSAPEEYGNKMSDGDIENIKKL